MKVLFTSPILKYPPHGGPALRIANSVKALHTVCDLYLHARISQTRESVEFWRAHSRKLFLSPAAKVQMTPSALIATLASDERLSAMKRFTGSDETEAAHLLQCAESIGADIIWFGYGNISYPVLKAVKERSSLPTVIDTDSVWSRYVMRGLDHAETEERRQTILAEGKAKEEEEAWGTRLSDITTAVSEVDAEYYRSLAERPDEQVRLFRNVIDIDSYTEASSLRAARPSTPSLFLGGSFYDGKNSPMGHAAFWFIENILPSVVEKHPDIILNIIGVGSKEVLASIDHPNVKVHGMVPSALPFLCTASASIVPLHFESGTRFKILEAGACRVPVVSTTLGAEGIPVTHEQDILIADEPQAFAEAICRMVESPSWADGLGNRLYDLVRRNFSIETLAGEGREILESLSRS